MVKIQILGTGCPKCKQLAENVAAAAKNIAIDCELEKVTKLDDIMSLGVMITPALVIDGQVKVIGKVPSIEEIEKILK